MAFRLFNGMFLAAFLASAAVQYNDPDSLVWILVYLAAAWMCLAQLRQTLSFRLPLVLLCLSLAWIAWLLPALAGGVSWRDIFESISMKTRAVEEAREIGGLALVAIWSAALLFRCRRGTH